MTSLLDRKFFKELFSLIRGYWFSEEKWKARGLLLVVVTLNLLMVYILVRMNEWYSEFYNAIQDYQKDAIWNLVGEFTILAFLFIGIAVYMIYLRQLLELKWRVWLTHTCLSKWLKNRAYYRIAQKAKLADNPEQRIQEDVKEFVELVLQLCLGFLKEMTTLAAFSVVLWNLSGGFTFTLFGEEFTIYGYMLWFSLLYSIFGTYFAHKVGKKLISLNFDRQRYEADFRFSMTRVRENSESIAFYEGEKVERKWIDSHFLAVVKNYFQIMKKLKILNFYINGYSQFAILVPIVLALPRYLSGALPLGGFMQTLSAFGNVQTALSYFVEAYGALAQFSAVSKRLTGFARSIKEIEAQNKNLISEDTHCDGLTLKNVSLFLPDKRVLLENLSLTLQRGDSLLITGASGVGKSTLLRTLASLFEGKEGKITFGEGKRLFLPQRPYLPEGSILDAIYYPQEAVKTKEERAKLAGMLHLVQLDHLLTKLDEVNNWSKILSLGEQQRIAFLRVFLTKPEFLFLDEATSAVDEKFERAIYTYLRKTLPQTVIVSVGHRQSLFTLHTKHLHFAGYGSWTLDEAKDVLG